MLDRLEQIDSDTILRELPEELRGSLGSSRFAPRLALRFGRRFAGASLFAPVEDEAERRLADARKIETLVARAGAHVLWRDLLRVVKRDEIDQIGARIGCDPRDAADNGKRESIGVVPFGETDPLAEAIWSEGALCWACWLAGRERSSARRLRVLTPGRIADLIPKKPIESAEQRALRRAVIDMELKAMTSASEEASDE